MTQTFDTHLLLEADGLECIRDDRTLFRDLATVRNAGIDIESDGQCFELSAKQLRSTLRQAL